MANDKQFSLDVSNYVPYFKGFYEYNIEYYGMDTYNIIINMLNKVNRAYNSLSHKSLVQLQRKLMLQYDKESCMLLRNAVEMGKRTNAAECEQYKELFNCLRNYLSHYLEKSMVYIVTEVLKSVEIKIDRLYISCNRNDTNNFKVYKNRNNLLVEVTNIQSREKIAQKLKGVFDTYDSESNRKLDSIKVEYEIASRLLNCSLSYSS